MYFANHVRNIIPSITWKTE